MFNYYKRGINAYGYYRESVDKVWNKGCELGRVLTPVAFAGSWMATQTTSHTTTLITTMSQRPETVVNFSQNPPRKRKAQEPGAQEERPASKRRKQARISALANNE